MHSTYLLYMSTAVWPRCSPKAKVSTPFSSASALLMNPPLLRLISAAISRDALLLYPPVHTAILFWISLGISAGERRGPQPIPSAVPVRAATVRHVPIYCRHLFVEAGVLGPSRHLVCFGMSQATLRPETLPSPSVRDKPLRFGPTPGAQAVGEREVDPINWTADRRRYVESSALPSRQDERGRRCKAETAKPVASLEAKVAVAAVRGERPWSIGPIQFEGHPNQIQDWKKKWVAEAEHVFGAGAIEAAHSERETQQLHAKIGQLTMEKDFLSNALGRDR